MSFPRYEQYKDSGVEWLGEVPEGWAVKPIKFLGRLKGGAGFPHVEQGVEGAELSFHKVNALSQASNDGYLQPSDNTISRDTAFRLGAFIFPPESIVFAKVGAALLLGRIRIISEEACLDNNMMGLVVYDEYNQVNFVKFAMGLVKFDLIANPGAVPSINEAQIGNFRLAIPPLPEQEAIATFLDHETCKIDDLVTEQEKLIELLKEKRQAVISHAVTKGLDPDAPMKDSGVEWLGEVPEGWDVAALKRGYSIVGGSTPRSDSDTFWEGDIIWVTPADLSKLPGLEVVDSARKITQAGLDSCGTSLVPSGSVILSTRAPIGTLGIAARSLCTNQGCKALVPREDQDSRFCAYLLLVSTEELNILGRGTTFLELSGDALGNFSFPFPSLPEQQAIAAFLDRETGKIDTLIEEAQKAIELMKERRTALISAAVTGKIDVRGYAECSAKEAI